MKKRSIISVILIIAMFFSMAAFTSCVNEEKEEEIKATIKIKGTTIDVSQDFVYKIVPSESTVLYLTTRMCKEIEGIDFEYDKEIDAVKKIGNDISDLFKEEYETEPTEQTTEDEEAFFEDQDEETTEEGLGEFYYDWVCTVNEKEATLSTQIKTGDKIEWKYELVKKLDKKNK